MGIISHKIVKINKTHICWGCAKEYQKGSIMDVVVSKYNNINRVYWCPKCVKLWQDPKIREDIDPDEGLPFGGFNPNF